MKQKIILLLFFSIILTLVNSNHIFAEITTKEESEKKTSLIEEQDQDVITEDDNIILDKNVSEAVEEEIQATEEPNEDQNSKKQNIVEKDEKKDSGNTNRLENEQINRKENYSINNNQKKISEKLSQTMPEKNPVLQNGITHPNVISLKKDLAKVGFPVSNNPNDYYGPITEKKVKEFQNYYGLNQSGIADEATLAKLSEVVNSPLQNGRSNPETRKLKQDLAKLGFVVPGNMTENFGELTEQQVKKFQQTYNLKVTGIADSKTLEKIAELIEDFSLSLGVYHPEVVKLKRNLAKAGFPVSSNPNDFYGSITEKKVREFQKYYGLNQTGKADKLTLEKLSEVVHSPLQNGRSNPETRKLKQDLAKLGFVVPGNMTENFGPLTEQEVKKFQKTYKLKVTGIADSKTLEKIAELIENFTLTLGMYHPEVVKLKKDLAKAGFPVSSNPNDFYGSITEKRVKEFQAYYNLNQTGSADQATLAKLSEVVNSPLQNGRSNPETRKLKLDLAKLGFIVPGNMTENFGPLTEQEVKKFQKTYNLKVTGIAENKTLELIKIILNEPLSIGMYRQDVIPLKYNLAKAGFPVSSNPNDFYGSITEKKVKEFQAYYGLNQTGSADQATLVTLSEIVNSPLQNGRSNPETRKLKQDLAKLGFVVPGNMTENFGPLTESVVRSFQKQYGLVQNGIGDEKTLSKINELLSQILKKGDKNSKVIELKQKLELLGFKVPGNTTENFGILTEGKVREFQEYYDLKVTGVVDHFTWEKIDGIISKSLKNGDYSEAVVELKKDLHSLGYTVPGNFTTHYGPLTANAVRSFQRDHSLPVSGVADYKTLEAIKKQLNRIVKIFIDPGHGGRDPGAIGYNIYEKDIVLDIARRTGEYLMNNYAGVQIKYSRTTDATLELKDRTNLANQWGADFFISFHNNAFNGKAYGFETYIYNGDRASRLYQEIIHNHIVNNLNVHDRGKKEKNLHVLRESNMPSILIEYLFIDNPIENQKLKDINFRKKLGELTGEAIAKAFLLKER